MNDEEPPRSAAARRAAELALVRVVHHYGRETLHSDKAIANWAPGHYCDGSTSGSWCGHAFILLGEVPLSGSGH